MSEQPAAAAVPAFDGPPCDICQAEPAQASLMFLADYSQRKFGMGCAPEFLRAMADQVEQATADAVSRETEPGPPLEPLPPQPDPLTANVVKSTHGHRRASRPEPAGVPGSDSESG